MITTDVPSAMKAAKSGRSNYTFTLPGRTRQPAAQPHRSGIRFADPGDRHGARERRPGEGGGLRAVPSTFLPESFRLPREFRGAQLHPARSDRPRGIADVLVRLTRAPFVSIALSGGGRPESSELALACDMSFASRRKRSCRSLKGRGPRRRRRADGARHGSWDGARPRSHLSADDIQAPIHSSRLREPCAPGYPVGPFVDDPHPHCLVRQVGDREHQAPRERSQPAARRRNQGGLGRLHGLRQATSGAGKNQSPPGARAPEARRLGKSTRIPRRTAGPRGRTCNGTGTHIKPVRAFQDVRLAAVGSVAARRPGRPGWPPLWRQARLCGYGSGAAAWSTASKPVLRVAP